MSSSSISKYQINLTVVKQVKCLQNIEKKANFLTFSDKNWFALISLFLWNFEGRPIENDKEVALVLTWWVIGLVYIFEVPIEHEHFLICFQCIWKLIWPRFLWFWRLLILVHAGALFHVLVIWSAQWHLLIGAWCFPSISAIKKGIKISFALKGNTIWKIVEIIGFLK